MVEGDVCRISIVEYVINSLFTLEVRFVGVMMSCLLNFECWKWDCRCWWGSFWLAFGEDELYFLFNCWIFVCVIDVACSSITYIRGGNWIVEFVGVWIVGKFSWRFVQHSHVSCFGGTYSFWVLGPSCRMCCLSVVKVWRWYLGVVCWMLIFNIQLWRIDQMYHIECCASSILSSRISMCYAYTHCAL